MLSNMPRRPDRLDLAARQPRLILVPRHRRLAGVDPVIVMQPSTGQTRLHMLQPTQSPLDREHVDDPAAGAGHGREPARADDRVACHRQLGLGTRSQRIDWWQPSSQAT